MENYYEILGVKKTANLDEIKKAYLAKLKKYHPDVYQGDKQIAQEKSSTLNQIYQTLKDDTLRKEYDIKTFGIQKPKIVYDDPGIFGELKRRIHEGLANKTPTEVKAKPKTKTTKITKGQKQANQKTKLSAELKEKIKLYIIIGLVFSFIIAIILVCLFV